MLAFLVRRLLLTLPILWIVVSLVFGLIHMVPGDNETCRTVHAEALTEALSQVIRRAQPDSAPTPAA